MSEEVIEMKASSEKRKGKKPKSKAREIIEWIFFGIFGVFFVTALVGNILSMVHKKENYGQAIRFGFSSYQVITNSMEPEIAKNSSILVYRQKVEKVKADFESGKAINVTFANVEIALDKGFEPDTPKYKAENGGDLVTSKNIMTHRLKEIHVTNKEYGKGKYIFVAAGINAGGDYSKEHQFQVFTEKQYLGTVVMSNKTVGKFITFVASPVGLIILLLIPTAYLIITSSVDIYRTLKEEEEAAGANSKPQGDTLSKISNSERERLKKELMDEMLKKRKGGSK